MTNRVFCSPLLLEELRTSNPTSGAETQEQLRIKSTIDLRVTDLPLCSGAGRVTWQQDHSAGGIFVVLTNQKRIASPPSRDAASKQSRKLIPLHETYATSLTILILGSVLLNLASNYWQRAVAPISTACSAGL